LNRSGGNRRLIRSLRPTNFFKVSDFDHGIACGEVHSWRQPSGSLAVRLASLAALRTKAMRHARISTGIVCAGQRDRTAPLPQLQPESDAAVEA
jgi:hypothetical protein